jgi:Zn-finger protein
VFLTLFISSHCIAALQRDGDQERFEDRARDGHTCYMPTYYTLSYPTSTLKSDSVSVGSDTLHCFTLQRDGDQERSEDRARDGHSCYKCYVPTYYTLSYPTSTLKSDSVSVGSDTLHCFTLQRDGDQERFEDGA